MSSPDFAYPSIVRTHARSQLHKLCGEYLQCSSQRVRVPAATAADSFVFLLENPHFPLAVSNKETPRVDCHDVETYTAFTFFCLFFLQRPECRS